MAPAMAPQVSFRKRNASGNGRSVERGCESQTHRPIVPADLRGTWVVEVPVQPGSVLVGRSLGTLKLPPDTLVVAIARGPETIIPRGDTHLREGDRLQILVRDDAITSLHEHLASLSPPREATRSSG
jgi:uncharacterized protein with PhoU and TrkA domain